MLHIISSLWFSLPARPWAAAAARATALSFMNWLFFIIVLKAHNHCRMSNFIRQVAEKCPLRIVYKWFALAQEACFAHARCSSAQHHARACEKWRESLHFDWLFASWSNFWIVAGAAPFEKALFTWRWMVGDPPIIKFTTRMRTTDKRRNCAGRQVSLSTAIYGLVYHSYCIRTF